MVYKNILFTNEKIHQTKYGVHKKMKKIIILLVSIVLMIACFFTSWLFFMSSGMIDEDTLELNEWKTVQIIRDLDKIPLIRIGADEVIFTSHGTLAEINDNNLLLSSWRANNSFVYSGNLPGIEEGDRIMVYYRYSPKGEVIVTKIKKISQSMDVLDFDACSSYPVEICPDGCVVCPPCPACSSISCQTEEFCERMGFDKSWYERIKYGLHATSVSSTVEVTEKEIHCLFWIDSELGMLLRESNIINITHYSLIINKAICEETYLHDGIISKGRAFGFCGKLQNLWDSVMQDCGSFEFYLKTNSSMTDTCLVLNDEIIFSEAKDKKEDIIIGNGTCK